MAGAGGSPLEAGFGRNDAASSAGLPPGPLGLPRRVVRNLAVKTLSEIPIKLIRLAMLILAARWLGRSEFGVYSYAVALGYMLVQFADLGLQFHLARLVSRERAAADAVLARVLRAKFCLVAAVAVVFLVLGVMAARPQERWLLWTVGAALVLNSFVELANYLFRGFQRLEYEARVNLLNVGLGTVAGLGAVRLGAGSIGLACGLLLGAVVSCAVAWGMIHRRFVPWSRWFGGSGGWLTALRPSLPIGLAVVLSVIYFRVDVLFLAHYRDAGTVGLYSAAYRIVESFMFIPGILLAALFPAFSEMTVREPATLPRLLRTSLRILLAIASVPALLLFLGADLIISLAFGESYRPAVAALRILSPGLVLIFLNYGLTHFLIALGRAKMNVLLAAACLAVNVVGNWILIPRYGMNAAAATTVVTEAVLFGGAFVLVLRGVRRLEREQRVGTPGVHHARTPLVPPEPEALPVRSPAAANPRGVPSWLAALFWIFAIQLPFELPASVVPLPGMVITHLEVTLLVLILGYLLWRARGSARAGPPGAGASRGAASPVRTSEVPEERRIPARGAVPRKRHWRAAVLNPQTWVLVWLGTLVVSAVLAPGLHLESIRFVLRSAVIASLFWVSRDLHRSGRSVAGLVVALAATVAIAGILEGGLDRTMEPLLRPFRPRPSFDDGVWRLTSTFSHANQTATWLGMSLPIVVALALRPVRSSAASLRAGWPFAAPLVLVGLVLWALLTTLSRGGIAAGLLVTTMLLGFATVPRRTRNRAAALLLVMAAVAGVRLGTSPGLRDRLHLNHPGPAYAALYNCPARLTVAAGSRTTVGLRVANTGFASWSTRSAFPVHLSYHLRDLAEPPGTSTEGARTALPGKIRPGESAEIEATLAAPSRAGLYLVAWDLVRESILWFTWHQVQPGMTLLRVVEGPPALAPGPDPRYQEWRSGMPVAERAAWLGRLDAGRVRPGQPDGWRHDAADPSLDPEKIPRRLLWKAALRLFRERPWTGWGPDTYRFLYAGKLGMAKPNTDLQAHDVYLELLATGGVFCLAAWLVFLGLLLFRLLRAERPSPGREVLRWGWAGMVLVFCLHGLVDSFFGSYELMGLFWIGAGALVAACEKVPPGKTDITETIGRC